MQGRCDASSVCVLHAKGFVSVGRDEQTYWRHRRSGVDKILKPEICRRSENSRTKRTESFDRPRNERQHPNLDLRLHDKFCYFRA